MILHFSKKREIFYVGSERLDQMLPMLLSTHMFIGGILGCFLDNLIPGDWQSYLSISSLVSETTFVFSLMISLHKTSYFNCVLLTKYKAL